MRPECRSQMVPTSCGCCETSTLLQFSPLCQVPDRRTPPRALFRLQQAQLNLHRELAAFPAHSAELQGCSHGRPLRPSEEGGSVFQTFFPNPLGNQDDHRLPPTTLLADVQTSLLLEQSPAPFALLGAPP